MRKEASPHREQNGLDVIAHPSEKHVGGVPGASMASDEMVVGFDRQGGVTKLRLTDPLMQRAEQSTLWITASEDGASATCVGVAPACKDLRSGPNKSEREPTSARSTDYGSGHLIPAFHGTGRTFSLLPSHPLDAASRSIDAPWSRA
jgi:hypothetical protein